MKYKYLFALLISFTIFACNNMKIEDPKLVIISKLNPQKNYTKWLLTADSSLVFINAFTTNPDSLDFYLNKASGILITGGEDINPGLYGKLSDTNRCESPDNFRDSIEMLLITYAQKHNVPLLGICRGHQMLTVQGGGTLIIDIPTDFKSDTLHRKNDNQTEHWVTIKKESLLYKAVQVDSGIIVSHHHQATEKVPEGFVVTASAPDGIIEALEPADNTKYLFMMGVQWHPERMDFTNPLSGNLAHYFVSKINAYKR